jgi:ribonuclease P protein component
MLPAASRMRARQDFALAVRRGRRAGDATLVVHYLGVPDTESRHEPTPARVGFVVPKAVGNAVVRKRVTRRLRHLVRDRLQRIPDGALVVVRALPPSAEAGYADLETAFDRAWERVTRPRPVAASTP